MMIWVKYDIYAFLIFASVDSLEAVQILTLERFHRGLCWGPSARIIDLTNYYLEGHYILAAAHILDFLFLQSTRDVSWPLSTTVMSMHRILSFEQQRAHLRMLRASYWLSWREVSYATSVGSCSLFNAKLTYSWLRHSRITVSPWLFSWHSKLTCSLQHHPPLIRLSKDRHWHKMNIKGCGTILVVHHCIVTINITYWILVICLRHCRINHIPFMEAEISQFLILHIKIKLTCKKSKDRRVVLIESHDG